ncbi:MAG: universal stress protein [Hyphomicrobiales bacterium]
MNDQQTQTIRKLSHILLPTDGSEFSAGAERIGIAMAAKSGSKLEILRIVLQGTELGQLGAGTNTRQAEEALAQLEGVKERAIAAGVDCTLSVRTATDPYQAIVDAARDTGTDLIVMGRRGRRGLARLMLGDATAKVMGYSPCAVMVVPEASEMWSGVLLASDGSRSSDAAATMAARLAQCCNVAVDVLSVKVPSHSERRQAETGPIVDRTVANLKALGIEANSIVEEGMADDVILSVAERRGDNLIILGSHGRTGIGRVLFGSKAERVINGSKCPVLVAKSETEKSD